MTRGWPAPGRITRPAAALAMVLLGAGVVGCEIGFVDRGGSFVADNRSDVVVLARIKKTVSTGSGSETVYEVIEVPASSRLVAAVTGMGGPVINQIDVLLESCEPVGTFFGFTKSGRVIQIDDGPTATLVPEWPDETEPLAKVVDRCPVAEASTSP